MGTFNNYSKNKTTKADIHHQEHERWTRRSFLQALGLAGGGSMLLASANITASVPSKLTNAIAQANTDRILVLMRLKGGNDGLNTIIPIYDFDSYANARPTIHYKENTLYKLNDDFGIPQAMQNLQGMWGEGAMKVVHGVGYQNQDLSHFKSSNIWASSDLEEIEDSGFLGRYLEGLHPDFLINPPEIPAAIQIGSIGNLIFDGQGVSNYALTVSNPEELERIGETGTIHSLLDLPNCTYGDRLSYLRSVTNNTFTYAKTIFNAYNSAKNEVEYTDKIGKQLAIVSRMIKGNLGTKIYMVSVDGFDTHANQAEKHAELWESISKNITLFYEDLKAKEMDEKVLSMTISEFGRRVKENGSQGTDHGQAAPILFFGPALQGNGFVGEHPNLKDLDPVGNLKFTTDFREIYSNVLKEWLCVDSSTVEQTLLGESFNTSDLGFSCKEVVNENDEGITAINEENQGEGITIAGEVEKAKISIYQRNGDTILELVKTETSLVNISLYAVTGQQTSIVVNKILSPQTHIFNLSQKVAKTLNQGVYVCRVLSGSNTFSRKVFL